MEYPKQTFGEPEEKDFRKNLEAFCEGSERINPDKLGEEDLELFRKFVSRKLRPEDLDKHAECIILLGRDPENKNESESSNAFGARIRNALVKPENMIWYNPEMYNDLFPE